MVPPPAYSLPKRLACAITCGSLLAAAPLPAQDVYTPIEPAPLTLADASHQPANEVALTPPAEGPPSSEVLGDGKNSVSDSKPSIEVRGDGTSISATPHRFQYGFRLTIRGVYDDNIFLRASNRVSDYYLAIEPGITLGFGDIVGRQENYIRFDYAPSIFLFADHSDSNAVQHLFRLEGQYRFSRLTLTFSQDVQLLEGSNLTALTSTNTAGIPALNLDAGGNTHVNIYNTLANFSYDLSSKTFLSGGVQYNVWDFPDLISSESFNGNLFFNYNYSPKLVVGLGGTGGHNWVDAPSPDQTFEQVNARFTYQVTGKISLNATGGVEFRQFDNSSASDHISPVFELGATYQPFDGTTLSLRGSRRTFNSAVFAAQDYTASSIVFGARQRLCQRFFLGLTAGYENDDYFATLDGVNATRTDNYYFVQPAVDVMVTRWLTVGAYYLHRQNNSAAANFSFRDNQVGVRASVTF
ncbi:MAG TPA: outer membrane beta-barrel protein [Chthoniobacterales bacterium]